MKKIYIISILVSILGITVTSCDMDRFPKTAIATDKSLESIDDASYWNNGIYNSFRARQNGLFVVVQERQADMLNASADYGNRGGAPHGWINFLAGDYDLRDVWSSYYGTMKNLNYFLSKSQDLKLEGEDAAKLKIYQGNAHFARAYYHFNLAIRYGNPYKAASASSDLCVPIISEFDIAAKPPRNTNAEVYKFILDEIAKAKANLAGVKGKAAADFFSVDAVTALEARVKLYMSDWNGAYAAATSLIKSNTYPLVAPKSENILNMWRHDKSTEEILQMYVAKPDELANGVVGFGADASKGICRPDWLPSQGLMDMYVDNDLRKSVYFDANQKTEFGGIVYKGIAVVSKFMGNPKLANTDSHPVWGYVPDGRHAPKVFRIAEMYLIAAEAGFESGKSDADTYLNALRVSRGLEKVTSTGAALLKEIRDERARELAFEGFRLWDLRRWGQPMQRMEPQAAKVSLDKDGNEVPVKDQYAYLAKGANGYYTLRIEPNNPKWIWGIPLNDIKVNTNLVQNPGW